MRIGKVLATVAAGVGAVAAAPVVLPAIAAVGAAGTAAAAAATACAGTAATAVTGAITVAGTAAASTAVGGAVASAATALGGAAATVGTAAASTAVGTAVTGAMGTVGAGIGAVVTAAEAAPVIGGVAANIATVSGTAAGSTAVGTIATTGTVGVVNVGSGVNKRKTAEDIKNVSIMKYDAERKNLEIVQNSTNEKLAKLGKLKLKAWGEGYPRFCEMYSKVKLPPNSKGGVALEGNLSITPEDLSEYLSLGGIKETVQTVASGCVVGTLAGIAVQNSAITMATCASTGTAISSLSGAAATNAKLAQLGGGALKFGGLGKAGGQMVLNGLSATQFLMVEGILFNVKGNKILENAKDIEYQTSKSISKMQDAEAELKRLALLSKSVQDELQQLYDVFLQLIVQAERTVERTREYVDFTVAEKQNFQKTCLAIKLISVITKQDLLDEVKEGQMNKVLDKETRETIQKVHQTAENGKLWIVPKLESVTSVTTFEDVCVDINLMDVGPWNNVKIIKIIHDTLGLDLNDAKKAVESAPCFLKGNVPKSKAEDIKRQIESEGAKVTLK